MALVCRHTTVADEERLSAFLSRVFTANAGLVSSAMLQWKYWTPRADCVEPRSFVMERNGQIVAHVGLWPVTVKVGSKSERGVHAMDWAADPHALGAGWSLFMGLTKTHDFVYGIGGEEITRTILPKLGFRAVAETLTWARPIRPWRQILNHQSKDSRLPLRLARNVWWSKTPAKMRPRGWAAVEVKMLDHGSHEAEANRAASLALLAERSESFFHYLQQCPVAPCLTFNMLHNGRTAGFFALSVVGEQARVAGVWLEHSSPENWRAAFQLAQDAALKHTNTSEIVARCRTKDSAAGAEQAGLRLRAQTPVVQFRNDGKLELPPLQFQLCDSDALFITGGFVT